MSSRIHLVRTVELAFTCGVIGVAVPLILAAQGVPAPVVQQASGTLLSSRLADQLGVKASPGQSAEVDVYGTLNGTLADPSKLARFGLTGLHEGARVTVVRTAPDRLRLEVDEIDPAPLTKKITLKIDDKGELSVYSAR